jgi:hypothetical protein
MSEPTPTSPSRRTRRREPKQPASLSPIVCARCGGPVVQGQQVSPLIEPALLRWSEHPVLSKRPVIQGIISADGSASRTDMSLGDQLRQRAAMGGDKECAELAAFEALWVNLIANALVAELRNESNAYGVRTAQEKHLDLADLVGDMAISIKSIDARRPQAANARTGALYQPGIGPHPETQAVGLLVSELASLAATRYASRLHIGVPYPKGRQKCDLCIGEAGSWDWAVEVKMLRLMGDNGKPNDNMLMHILSPYPNDRSALTDCLKLAESGLSGRKAVVIYGFDYPSLPMDPAIEAFETLAMRWVLLGPRVTAGYDDLVHPVHRAGRVFGWEVQVAAAT